MANIFRTGGVSTMRYALNEEKWTGDYWIDGKKIYRKVVSKTVNNQTTDYIDLSTSDIDYIVDMKMNIKTSDGNTYYNAGLNVNFYAGSFMTSDKHATAMLSTSLGTRIIEIVVLVEYTKSTEGSES